MNQRSAYASLGLGLLLAFFLQHLCQIKWPLMAALQQHATYKHWSGLLLMTYLAYQWYLAFLRTHGRMHAAKRHYKLHKWLPVLRCSSTSIRRSLGMRISAC